MRILFLSFLFLFILNVANAKVQPDTVTFWQVYLNGYLVKSFNENERTATLIIKLNEITKTEKLLVKYFRDTPCANCPTHLVIYDDQKNVVVLVNGKGTFASLSFGINKLVDKWNSESPKYFEAYYWENNSTHHKLLFVLKFE